MRFLFVFILMLVPLTGMAQEYPRPTSKTVNDFGGLLSEGTAAQLSDQLTALDRDHGIELTVVTFTRQAAIAPNMSFEDFSTNLFNAWGVGDATRNDGIMVLVLDADSRVRIELGQGIDTGWNAAAQKIIDQHFLPAFRNYDYDTGLQNGVTTIIQNIAIPHAVGTAPPAKAAPVMSFVQLFLVGIFGFFGFRALGKRYRKCPNCGNRSLKSETKVIRRPVVGLDGENRKITTCSKCDYKDQIMTITSASSNSRSNLSSGSGGSFGGGRSGGGGASGKW